MALASSFVCFFLSLLLIFVQANGLTNSTCRKSFSCGNLTDLSFPFSLSTQSDCGIMSISGCDAKPFPRIQLLPGGDWYYALQKPFNYTVLLADAKLNTMLTQHKCQAFNNKFSLPDSPSISFTTLSLHNFFKCSSNSNNTPYITQKMSAHFNDYEVYDSCDGFTIYYKLDGADEEDILADDLTASCSRLLNCQLTRDHMMVICSTC